MKHHLSWWRVCAGILAAAVLLAGLLLPQAAYAGTTGNITGTVRDSFGKPLADVKVSAASLSQSATTSTDANGFYTLINLTADTYTVSFQKEGLQALSVPGIVVFQDQSVTLNEKLTTELKTIAAVRASGSSNLVKPNQGSDVYTISGEQLKAATNPVNSLETIYQWMAVTPGVTSNGFPAQPRIRGGQVTDLGYEFEGIPIQDRITGFFTSNLSNTGLANVEVYTGGLAGAGAVNGTGYFNSVLKTGTYPGFTSLGLQFSSPEANQYLNFERGWATPDHKFSYYIGFSGVNSQNQYDYGEYTFPGVVYPPCFCDGPGPVKERNWVGNFHYRPDAKNDIQLVATNDIGDFNFNYLLSRKPGEPLPLAISPCPGAQPTFNTGTYAQGGTAPNGQPCPLGVYWSPLGSGQGNLWHHYGGLGKIQLNHNFNDHSFLNLRVAENFNQYIFDQPVADPNIPAYENTGAPYSTEGTLGVPDGSCPVYPYAAGTPVQYPTWINSKGQQVNDTGDMCATGDGLQVFWGNRRSNIWQAAADYTNALSDRVTLRAGISHETDNNTFEYYNTHVFTVMPDGSLKYPGIDQISSYPTNQQIAYINPELHFGKLMISPGLTYAQRHYGFPADQGYATGNGICPSGETCNVYGGGYTAHAWDPTINGTFTFDPNNVISFSYGDTTSFISSAYIYASSIAANTGYDGVSNIRNPFLPGTTFEPQQNHAAELLWEHNFGSNTTMRVGPYYNKTSNYYGSYRPFLGYFDKPCNALNTSACTPCPGSFGSDPNCITVFAKNSILTNNSSHQVMGAEFALNHVNNAPMGTSYWISATYDNYWTTSAYLAGAYINSELPDYLVNKGYRVRAVGNPLWSGTILMDYHSNGFHFDPLVYYQGDTFFSVGSLCTSKATGLKYPCGNQQIAHGWWNTKLTVYKELGPSHNFTVGFTASNLFDNVTDTTPCPSDGTGCWPFNGAQSGVVDTPNSLIYQNYSQTPRTFYFFAGVKL